MVRERTQTNSVQRIKDYDAFFEKAEPRRLSDWQSDRSLKPMNSSLLHLLNEAGLDKVDDILKPGCLHTKLRRVVNSRLKFT